MIILATNTNSFYWIPLTINWTGLSGIIWNSNYFLHFYTLYIRNKSGLLHSSTTFFKCIFFNVLLSLNDRVVTLRTICISHFKSLSPLNQVDWRGFNSSYWTTNFEFAFPSLRHTDSSETFRENGNHSSMPNHHKFYSMERSYEKSNSTPLYTNVDYQPYNSEIKNQSHLFPLQQYILEQAKLSGKNKENNRKGGGKEEEENQKAIVINFTL